MSGSHTSTDEEIGEDEGSALTDSYLDEDDQSDHESQLSGEDDYGHIGRGPNLVEYERLLSMQAARGA